MERDGPALAKGPHRIPVVYVSYSDDSSDHLSKVTMFAGWLSRNGCDVRFRHSRQPTMLQHGLDSWTETEVLAADFVVLICTKFYREDADRMDGGQVKHEVDLVKQQLRKKRIYSPYIPVLFPGSTEEDIPRCVVQAVRYEYDKNNQPDDLLYHVYGKEKVELRRGCRPELKSVVVGDAVRFEEPLGAAAGNGHAVGREELQEDRLITIQDLRHVFKMIFHKWKLVARELGPRPVLDYQIEGIQSSEKDNRNQCYEMLKVWMENNRSTGGAKVSELIRVLVDADIGLLDAAEEAFGAKFVTHCRRQLVPSLP